MGLLSIIRKVKRREREMRLLVVGLDNAGKTTIVKRLNGEDTSSISPTLGFNITTVQYSRFRVSLWDVGGQATLRPYWRNYFECTDGAVWVVDCTDRRRLGGAREEMHAIMREEKLAGASLLILANKQDVKGALSAEEIAKELEVEKFEGDRHWKVVPCSAVVGNGVLEGFDWLVSDIGARIYMFD